MIYTLHIRSLLITSALAALLILTASCGRKGDIIPPGSVLPGPPDGMAVELADGSVILVWGIPEKNTAGGPIEDLTGFRVMRALLAENEEDCPCKYQEVANIDLEYPVGAMVGDGRVAWSDDGNSLEFGRRYSYSVSAYNADGFEGPGVETGPIDYLQPPGKVAGLTATPGDTEISLSWEAVPGASGYRVYRPAEEDSPLETPLVRTPVKETAYTDTGLTNNLTYHYAVSALAGEGPPLTEGPPSDVVSATPVDTTPPATPTGLMAVQGDGFVLLSWEPVFDLDLKGYYVYREAEGSKDKVRLTDEPVRYITYRDDTVEAGKVYTYFVSAVDNAEPPNESPLSAPATSR